MLTDLRYALRLLRRSPAYSLVVAVVVAVGIAANLVAFGLFKAMALTPLAGVAQAGTLEYVGSRNSSGQLIPLSYPDYLDIRDRAFPGLAAWGLQPLVLTHGGGTRLVQTELVTGNYFDALHVRAQLGRTITPAEAATIGQQPVVVLSDGLWRSAFGASPTIVGSAIRINNYPLTVIGVADHDFHGGIVGLATDLFVPITLQRVLTGVNELEARDDHWVQAFMRRDDAGSQADTRAAQIGSALAAEHPIETLPERAVIVPIWQWPAGAQTFLFPAVRLLGAMAVLLLVVVSANVAGLVLVRSLTRRGETAARLTLGATRGRVMRQLMIESLVLAVPATILGFMLPALLQSFLGAAAANVSLPLFFNTNPDRLVITAAVLLGGLSALIYGIGPALRLSRIELTTVLNEDLGRAAGRAGRFRSALVVAQIAVAIVLAVGTALIVRTLAKAQHTNAGFDAQHVTWAAFDVRAGGYDEPRGGMLYSRLLDSVRDDPAILDASLSEFLPLSLIDWMNWGVHPDGYQARRGEGLVFAVNSVSSRYFRTLGIPLVAGREIDERDTGTGEAHVVINETFARRFWGTPEAALGRGLAIGTRHGTVIGVARDIKYARLDEAPRPYLYVASTQFYSASMMLQVRSGADTAAVLSRVRARALAVDPSLSVLRSGPMSGTLRAATSIYETLARMLTLIGAMAVGVAALGVYGLVAYTVKQRAQEIGIRTALGASRGTIVGHFMRRSLVLSGIGGVVGVAAAAIVARLMRTLLFGVASTDLTSFTVATVFVIGCVAGASLVPAWRAATMDPIAALRRS